MLSQMSNFTIPKAKSKLSLKILEKDSSAYRHILRDIQSSISHDFKYKLDTSYWIHEIYEVFNPQLQTRYNKTKREWRDDRDYNADALSDQFGFLNVTTHWSGDVYDLIKDGTKIGNFDRSVIADPSKGVQLYRHLDIVTAVPSWKYRRVLLMFKFLKGKTKGVDERMEHLSDMKREPQFGVDTLFCKANIRTSKNKELSTMWYIYNMNDLDLAEVPPQICPIAMIDIEYQDEEAPPTAKYELTKSIFKIDKFQEYLIARNQGKIPKDTRPKAIPIQSVYTQPYASLLNQRTESQWNAATQSGQPIQTPVSGSNNKGAVQIPERRYSGEQENQKQQVNQRSLSTMQSSVEPRATRQPITAQQTTAQQPITAEQLTKTQQATTQQPITIQQPVATQQVATQQVETQQAATQQPATQQPATQQPAITQLPSQRIRYVVARESQKHEPVEEGKLQEEYETGPESMTRSEDTSSETENTYADDSNHEGNRAGVQTEEQSNVYEQSTDESETESDLDLVFNTSTRRMRRNMISESDTCDSADFSDDDPIEKSPAVIRKRKGGIVYVSYISDENVTTISCDIAPVLSEPSLSSSISASWSRTQEALTRTTRSTKQERHAANKEMEARKTRKKTTMAEKPVTSSPKSVTSSPKPVTSSPKPESRKCIKKASPSPPLSPARNPEYSSDEERLRKLPLKKRYFSRKSRRLAPHLPIEERLATHPLIMNCYVRVIDFLYPDRTLTSYDDADNQASTPITNFQTLDSFSEESWSDADEMAAEKMDETAEDFKPAISDMISEEVSEAVFREISKPSEPIITAPVADAKVSEETSNFVNDTPTTPPLNIKLAPTDLLAARLKSRLQAMRLNKGGSVEGPSSPVSRSPDVEQQNSLSSTLRPAEQPTQKVDKKESRKPSKGKQPLTPKMVPDDANSESDNETAPTSYPVKVAKKDKTEKSKQVRDESGKNSGENKQKQQLEEVDMFAGLKLNQGPVRKKRKAVTRVNSIPTAVGAQTGTSSQAPTSNQTSISNQTEAKTNPVSARRSRTGKRVRFDEAKNAVRYISPIRSETHKKKSLVEVIKQEKHPSALPSSVRQHADELSSVVAKEQPKNVISTLTPDLSFLAKNFDQEKGYFRLPDIALPGTHTSVKPIQNCLPGRIVREADQVGYIPVDEQLAMAEEEAQVRSERELLAGGITQRRRSPGEGVPIQSPTDPFKARVQATDPFQAKIPKVPAMKRNMSVESHSSPPEQMALSQNYSATPIHELLKQNLSKQSEKDLSPQQGGDSPPPTNESFLAKVISVIKTPSIFQAQAQHASKPPRESPPPREPTPPKSECANSSDLDPHDSLEKIQLDAIQKLLENKDDVIKTTGAGAATSNQKVADAALKFTEKDTEPDDSIEREFAYDLLENPDFSPAPPESQSLSDMNISTDVRTDEESCSTIEENVIIPSEKIAAIDEPSTPCHSPPTNAEPGRLIKALSVMAEESKNNDRKAVMNSTEDNARRSSSPFSPLRGDASITPSPEKKHEVVVDAPDSPFSSMSDSEENCRLEIDLNAQSASTDTLPREILSSASGATLTESLKTTALGKVTTSQHTESSSSLDTKSSRSTTDMSAKVANMLSTLQEQTKKGNLAVSLLTGLPVVSSISPTRGSSPSRSSASKSRRRSLSRSRSRSHSPKRRRRSRSRSRSYSPVRRQSSKWSRSRSRSISRHRYSPKRSWPRFGSRSPNRFSGSPRRRSRSLSPRRRRRSRSLRRRSRSPRRRSTSRGRSRSPRRRRRSRSPRRRGSSSPRRRKSISPGRSNSPKKKSLSERSFSPRRRRSYTPRKHSRSPGRRSLSNRRYSRSPRRRRSSSLRSSRSPRRRRSRSPKRKRSLSPRRRSRSVDRKRPLAPEKSLRRKASPSPKGPRSPSPSKPSSRKSRSASPSPKFSVTATPMKDAEEPPTSPSPSAKKRKKQKKSKKKKKACSPTHVPAEDTSSDVTRPVNIIIPENFKPDLTDPSPDLRRRSATPNSPYSPTLRLSPMPAKISVAADSTTVCDASREDANPTQDGLSLVQQMIARRRQERTEQATGARRPESEVRASLATETAEKLRLHQNYMSFLLEMENNDAIDNQEYVDSDLETEEEQIRLEDVDLFERTTIQYHKTLKVYGQYSDYDVKDCIVMTSCYRPPPYDNTQSCRFWDACPSGLTACNCVASITTADLAEIDEIPVGVEDRDEIETIRLAISWNKESRSTTKHIIDLSNKPDLEKHFTSSRLTRLDSIALAPDCESCVELFGIHKLRIVTEFTPKSSHYQPTLDFTASNQMENLNSTTTTKNTGAVQTTKETVTEPNNVLSQTMPLLPNFSGNINDNFNIADVLNTIKSASCQSNSSTLDDCKPFALFTAISRPAGYDSTGNLHNRRSSQTLSRDNPSSIRPGSKQVNAPALKPSLSQRFQENTDKPRDYLPIKQEDPLKQPISDVSKDGSVVSAEPDTTTLELGHNFTTREGSKVNHNPNDNGADVMVVVGQSQISETTRVIAELNMAEENVCHIECEEVSVINPVSVCQPDLHFGKFVEEAVQYCVMTFTIDRQEELNISHTEPNISPVEIVTGHKILYADPARMLSSAISMKTSTFSHKVVSSPDGENVTVCTTSPLAAHSHNVGSESVSKPITAPTPEKDSKKRPIWNPSQRTQKRAKCDPRQITSYEHDFDSDGESGAELEHILREKAQKSMERQKEVKLKEQIEKAKQMEQENPAETSISIESTDEIFVLDSSIPSPPLPPIRERLAEKKTPTSITTSINEVLKPTTNVSPNSSTDKKSIRARLGGKVPETEKPNLKYRLGPKIPVDEMSDKVVIEYLHGKASPPSGKPQPAPPIDAQPVANLDANISRNLAMLRNAEETVAPALTQPVPCTVSTNECLPPKEANPRKEDRFSTSIEIQQQREQLPTFTPPHPLFGDTYRTNSVRNLHNMVPESTTVDPFSPIHLLGYHNRDTNYGAYHSIFNNHSNQHSREYRDYAEDWRFEETSRLQRPHSEQYRRRARDSSRKNY